MDISLGFSLAIGAARAVFASRGDTRAVGEIDKLLDARQSGANVDAQLQVVADGLNNDQPIDWDQVDADREAAVNEFLSA